MKIFVDVLGVEVAASKLKKEAVDRFTLVS
jgi:hypothetical protein